jgi:hypothetical protein
MVMNSTMSGSPLQGIADIFFQHDNLTGFPLTHAREGRHRWSIASGHRHRSPPRRAGRMVAPTRYARIGFLNLINIIPISYREHCTEPGTVSRTAETKGPKLPPSDFMYLQSPHIAAFNPANPPAFGTFVTVSETLGTKWTAWWRREDSNYVPSTQSYSNRSL